MLADHLVKQRQAVLRQVSLRASVAEKPGLARGREERLSRLLDELIEALQQRPPKHRPATSVSDEVYCRERELLREEVIGEVARQSLPLPLTESVMLSDWASASDRRRLREKSRRLCLLLDDVSAATIIFAADGRIEYLNRHAASRLRDATGIPLDQLVGKVAAKIGLGLDPERLVALARGSTSAEEFLFGRWCETTYRAIYSLAGDVESVAFVARDIHEPRLARMRLDVLSKLSATVGSVDYDSVAEALARVAIPELADWCVVNLVEDTSIGHSAVVQCNPAKTALEEAVTHAIGVWRTNPLWVEMKLTRGFQLLSDVSGDLLRKFTFDEDQYRLLSAAGVRSIMVQPVVSRGRMVAIFNFMYTTESGRRYGADHPALTAELALHAAHIIENARLVTDLRTTEARFRVAVAAAKTAVFEQDSSLRYRWYYNPFMADHGEAMPGKTVEEVFSAEDAAALKELKLRSLHGESVCDEVSLTQDGVRRQFREAVEPLRDAANDVVGIIGSATDITEEKRVQQQLSETLSFRDRMVAVLQHDLRNPLNAVTMAAAAALEQDLPDQVRGKLQVIQGGAGRMGEMIATLLDFTRVRMEGRLPLSRSPVDLGASTRRVVDEARAAWPGRAIECEMRGDVSGEWDAARMEQAVSNLVANALQHGNPGTPVQVSIDGTGRMITLKVKNQGPPIPTELMPVLFEPFSRGDVSPHGLGLGLFIVKEIATAHGGTVTAESNAEAGTIFTLRLARTA